MRNVKFISMFAACGFVLSFVFGLFSHSSFISVFIKAILFSVIFGLLGFLVSLIFKKFLLDPSSDDFGTADFSDLAAKPSTESPKVGQHVDIVVEDEELTPSDSDNHFVVGDNHQMLKNTDIKENSVVTFDNLDEERESVDFVPLRKAETEKNVSGTESVAPNEIQSLSSPSSESSDEEIDTLPDMENLTSRMESGTDDGTSETYNDSELVSSASTYKKSDGSTPDVKDASLIAKAISTALAEEDAL